LRELLIAETPAFCERHRVAAAVRVDLHRQLSVAILLTRGYRGSFAAKGARNAGGSEPAPP
jgi:hypothetical protein